MEYGFFVPGNSCEKIDISLNQVVDFVRIMNAKKINFIKNHGLDKELFIASDGLSYNLRHILTIHCFADWSENNLIQLLYNNQEELDLSPSVCGNFYLYLKQKFEQAHEKLLNVINLTSSGHMLLGFLRSRIHFIDTLLNKP